MEMTIDTIVMAANELRDTCPDSRVSKIVPAYDGVCFQAEDGYTYKYEYASGCVYRSYKADWRTNTPRVKVKG